MLNYETLVQEYRKREELVKAIEDKAKAEVKPHKELMDKLVQAMNVLLIKDGRNSAKTPYGTAYRSQWKRVKITDREKYVRWLASEQAFDIIPNSVLKDEALNYIESAQERQIQDGVEPIGVPGLEVETGVQVKVRKS